MAKATKKKVSSKKKTKKKTASKSKKKVTKKKKVSAKNQAAPRPPLVGKTTIKTPADRTPNWYIVDLKDTTLGHAATLIANTLRGKKKAEFHPSQDLGDFVIVVNASKLKLSGKKLQDKTYYWHTGYMGHLRQTNAEKLLQKHPERLVEEAVKGMLPHNRLGRKQIRKLFVYADAEHPHKANKPQPLTNGAS